MEIIKKPENKENEWTKPDIEGGGWCYFYVCEECRTIIDWKQEICPTCKRRINWNG